MKAVMKWFTKSEEGIDNLFCVAVGFAIIILSGIFVGEGLAKHNKGQVIIATLAALLGLLVGYGHLRGFIRRNKAREHFQKGVLHALALHNSKDAEARKGSQELRQVLTGLDLRGLDAQVFHLLFEAPTKHELQREAMEKEITLERLQCTYEVARQIAESEFRECMTLTTEPRIARIAAEHLRTLAMMDEMYGSKGDKGNIATVNRLSSVTSTELEELREDVSYWEQAIGRDPENTSNWSLLARDYDGVGEHKKAEQALRKAAELSQLKSPAVTTAGWDDNMHLAMLYFAAVSNSVRHRPIRVWPSRFSAVTPEALGYTPEQVRALAKQYLGNVLQIANEAGLFNVFYMVLTKKMLETALQAVTSLSSSDFAEYDEYE
jgi:tetratricopeptide (TPR) repeat protein